VTSDDSPRILRASAVLALLVSLAYGRSLGNDFVFDDAIFLERDARLESLSEAPRLFAEPLWAFTSGPDERGVHHYYRPLQLLPLLLSKTLADGRAWPVHLLSLLLHLANAVLVYALAFKLVRHAGVALVLAALFALHPSLSESVLWASDIAGLGATACLLSALMVHASALGAWRAPLAVAPLALLAPLFKETGVLLLALMAVFDATARRDAVLRSRLPRAGVAAVADYAGVVGALVAYGWLRVRALGAFLPGADRLELTPMELVLNALALVPSFVMAFLWPLDLNMYRDFDVVRTLNDPRVVAGTAIVALMAVGFVAAVTRARVIAFALAWIAITVVPHLIVRWPQLNAFAERYLYLPSIGVFLALAPATARLANGSALARRAGTVAAVILLVAFAARDARRSFDWKDEITLYSVTLAQSPRAEMVRNNLALRYLHEGRPLEGIPIQRELLRIDEAYPRGWHNLGLLLLAADDLDGARDAFERAAALEPLSAATALNLGYVYDKAGRREDAVQQYFRAVRLAPRDARAWYNLAIIANEHGQLGNARTALEAVLSRTPDDAAALSLRRSMEGRPSRAVTPSERRQTLRRCNDAKALAESGRSPAAIVLLYAAAWHDEAAALPHHYLANLAFLDGRIDDAIAHEREALARHPHNALYRSNLAALESARERAPFAEQGSPRLEDNSSP
jgi:Flp pilus assembly protein TadD